MLAPSLVVLVTFVLYPLGKAIVLGQQRCDVQGENCRSNGWDQYWDVFRSDEFQHALLVTTKFALITVPLGLALGVGLAVLADKWLRGVGLFRAVFSSTVATSVAVASLMWLFLLQPEIGALVERRVDQRPVPRRQEPGSAARPGDGAGVGRDVERVGEPRLHVHPRDRVAAGHPEGPARSGGDRRCRRNVAASGR